MKYLRTLFQLSPHSPTAAQDVFRLSKVLAESEGYAHAYQTLVDEVDALVDRNLLAEEEAQQLSKFNAELLSHKNPAQKIMYVDRIRQELAEVKQVRLLLGDPGRFRS